MPGDLPHVREKSPGIFLFISYLMYKERYISFSPGEVPLMFIYSQRKIFENLSTSYLCKKYTKLKINFLYFC